MLVYAAPEDMPGPRPENAEEVLLLASRLVYEATVTAFYRTGSDGMPTDPTVRSLFKQATIAQAKYWADLDIDPTMGAIGATSEKRVSTKSIGSASVSYDFRAAQDNVAARIESLNTLCATADAILAQVRRGPVIVHG